MVKRRNDTFEHALDEAGRNDDAPNDSGAGQTAGPRVRGVVFGPASGSGGKARFGFALDWTEEPADRPAPPQPPQLSLGEPASGSGDTSVEIAAELGLGEALTIDQLSSRWRGFVWRNHPDRQPEAARERANTRVAIANTLYDRARRELFRPQRSPRSPNENDG